MKHCIAFSLLLPSLAYGSGLADCYTSPLGLEATNEGFASCEKFRRITLEEILSADDMDFSKEGPIQAVRLSNSGKSILTKNKMGFDIVSKGYTSWVSTELEKFLTEKKEPAVIDLGAGFGGLVRLSLGAGATVVYNDMHVPHIEDGIRYLPMADFERLILNSDRFPSETDFPKESFDAVILHRVVVLLSPEELEAGLSKVHDWLKPGGRVFMVGFAPQHGRIKKTFLPVYEQKWKDGELWPGYKLDVKKHMPDQSHALPDFIHVMDGRPMEAALTRHGFKVIKSAPVSLQHLSNPQEGFVRDGGEHFGVVGGKFKLK